MKKTTTTTTSDSNHFVKLLKTLLQCIGKSESNQSQMRVRKNTDSIVVYGSLINIKKLTKERGITFFSGG